MPNVVTDFTKCPKCGSSAFSCDTWAGFFKSLEENTIVFKCYTCRKTTCYHVTSVEYHWTSAHYTKE